MSNEKLDVEGVIAKFGVPPERIVDYLALIGDSVDNVPGVEKVGPKTAAKWIAEHGSLDAVMAAAPTIKGVVGENLRKALDWLPQGRRLVTVKTDCDLSGHVLGWPEFDALALGEIDRPALLAFFDRYGFSAMRRELEAAATAVEDVPSAATIDVPAAVPSEAIVKRYATLTTPDALDAWMACVEATELTSLDTETDSLDPLRAALIGISMSIAPGQAAYIPLRHSYAGAPDQLPVDAVLARLKPWLENPNAAKVGQNTKFDTHVFAGAGIAVRGYRHDTLLQSYVLEAHKPHSLESLAFRHLGRTGLTYEEVCGKGANQIPFQQVEVGRATEYSCEDSDMALHVHQALLPRIEEEAGLARIYAEIEMPISALLTARRAAGRADRLGALARRAKPRTGRAHGRARGRGLRDRRAALQSRQPQADRRNPVRQARPAGRAQDCERRAVD